MIKSNLILLLLFLAFSSCNKDDSIAPDTSIDHKHKMREFVIGLSEYSKEINSNFYIIPQNGIELISSTGDEDGQVHLAYSHAIDGHGQEDLFYGYDEDDQATPGIDNDYLRAFLDMSKNDGNRILVTDYCSTHSNMNDSYVINNTNGNVSFSADHRELDNIPDFPTTIYAENENEVITLNEVQNFLYLINPENFNSKADFINAVIASNYDLLIMDLFFHDGTEFTFSEIDQLKSKANGGSRLIISYMSIGEAEDYRYYWESDWYSKKPVWLKEENPDWAGNFKVEYWNQEWQNIIYGNENSYLRKIVDANFDGVYLDIIDAFEYFE